ncbi:hypothetical protein QT391_22530, partial [Xanthomonas citri pv. citri]
MTNTTRHSYAPRSRGGLLISCAGFGSLAATTVTPAVAHTPGPPMSIGFVAAIIVIVYVPRLITVGSSWPRAALPRTFATIVFSGSAAAALAAAVVSDARWLGYVAVALILGGIISVA